MYEDCYSQSLCKVTVWLYGKVRQLFYFKKIFKYEYFMISVSAKWESVRKENEQVNE